MKYILFHREHPVLALDVDEDTGTIAKVGEQYSLERMPLGVLQKGNIDRKKLNEWWLGRSIPASRSGIRDALEKLRISTPQLLLTKCYGLSLSDQYWVRPEASNIKWEDVNFFDNPFSDDVGNILFGEILDKGELNLMSPDNTSDGWLKKKWVISDGKRQLIKSGSNPAQQEPYNEVLASAIMRRLDIPHIPYTLTVIDDYPYSVCDDFITKDTELIPAWHIIQTQKMPNNISLYKHYLSCCDNLGIPGASDFLDHMLTVDYLIVNEDRHFNNFGVIRNANTLDWISTAPIYDCGTSMWHDKFTHLVRSIGKLPSKPFRSTHSEQIKLVKSFKWFNIKALLGIDEEFREILSGSLHIDEARRSALCYGIQNRVKQLGVYIRERSYEAR
ncbi:MAG: excisionase [Oscillospiraceae bacterium]|nr:excisionase [Oscillospiraceae bacterium]